MKLKHILTICLLALGLAAARGQEVKANIPGKSEQPAASVAKATTYTEPQLLEELGWYIGKRAQLSELELSKEEVDSVLKGIGLAASGKDSPFDLEKIGPAMDEFMQKKQATYMNKLKTKNATTNADFFKKLKENKNVVELPSGLRYEIVKPGAGPFPKDDQTVRVHYTGTLLDGSVFDSSVQRGEPAEFGLKEVIPGWTEGIQKVNKGGKIKLYVPPQLAYGDDGRPGIPPGSTLIFEVELLEIKAPGAAAAPAAKK
ncbi:MAG: FKBP-type peptidyl-prolyl cis-trans isomerase [Opitutaceae bacterium]|nr:FKBP-type peptidyl-prolyl cis-trans isomerase [Opitutaceae bacterium]